MEYICAHISSPTYTVADIINLLDWLRYFVEQMARFTLGDRACCGRYMVLCREVLLMEHLQRMKTQITQLFENIEGQVCMCSASRYLVQCLANLSHCLCTSICMCSLCTVR